MGGAARGRSRAREEPRPQGAARGRSRAREEPRAGQRPLVANMAPHRNGTAVKRHSTMREFEVPRR